MCELLKKMMMIADSCDSYDDDGGIGEGDDNDNDECVVV